MPLAPAAAPAVKDFDFSFMSHIVLIVKMVMAVKYNVDVMLFKEFYVALMFACSHKTCEDLAGHFNYLLIAVKIVVHCSYFAFAP